MPTQKRKKKLTPAQAKTFNECCMLASDNSESKDYWWLLDAELKTFYIHEQKSGESSKQDIAIPRKVFDKIVNWYLTGKKNGGLIKRSKK